MGRWDLRLMCLYRRQSVCISLRRIEWDNALVIDVWYNQWEMISELGITYLCVMAALGGRFIHAAVEPPPALPVPWDTIISDCVIPTTADDCCSFGLSLLPRSCRLYIMSAASDSSAMSRLYKNSSSTRNPHHPTHTTKITFYALLWDWYMKLSVHVVIVAYCVVVLL